MKNNKVIEISIKPVFIGKRSAEQTFIDLILHKVAKKGNRLETSANRGYTKHNVVFPAVHAPERGIKL
jgi:hypothetical protein